MKLALVFLSLFTPLALAKSFTLSDQTQIVYELDSRTPQQTVHLMFHGGPAKIPENLQGLSSIYADILNSGPKNLSEEEYKLLNFKKQRSFYAYPQKNSFYISVSAFPEDLPSAIEATLHTIRHPRTTVEKFNEAKNNLLNNTIKSLNNMDTQLGRFSISHFTGGDSFYFDGTGTPKTIKNISKKEFSKYYARLTFLKNMKIYTYGPMDKKALQNSLKPLLLKSQKRESIKPSFNLKGIAKKHKGSPLEIFIIDNPNAQDNKLSFYQIDDIPYGTRKYLTGAVTQYIMGGGLSGYLGNKLRTEMGLTYHAGSTLASFGWEIYTFGANDKIAKLIEELHKSIPEFKEQKITNEKLEQAKSFIIAQLEKSQELPKDKINREKNNFEQGRKDVSIPELLTLLKKITLKEVLEYQKSLTMDSGKIYLAGDAKVLKESIKNAGLEKIPTTVVKPKDIF